MGPEVDHEGELGAVEWVWVEGGAPAGSRREGASEDQCIHEGASMEEARAYRAEAWGLDDPWEIQKEALGEACPWEEVQDAAFQEVAGVVVVLQSPEAQHGGVLGHGGHGGPAASGTSLDGASHLGGTGEDVNVRDQDVQLLEFPLLGGHVLQPQVASGAGAWLGVSREAGLQEVAPEVGRSQEEACLVEEVQNPGMKPQGWGQKVEGVRRQTADEGGQPGTAGSGLPEVAQLLSHGARPSSPS